MVASKLTPGPRQPVAWPLVYVVILNWNNHALTSDTLRSLSEQTYPAMHTIVLDNASRDQAQTLQSLKAEFPGVITRASRTNLGFAGGCNLGITMALEMGADYVLLLNNDVILQPDVVETLVSALEGDSSAAAAGPLIMYASQPDVVWFAGGRISMDGWGGRVLPVHIGLGERWESAAATAGNITNSDWLAGTCLLIRRSAIERTGLMDPAYFLYWEDVDWCYRLRKEGYKLLFVPSTRIWHRVNATTGALPSLGSVYYWERNRLLFLEKWCTWRSRIIAWGKILWRELTWRIHRPAGDPQAAVKLEAYSDYLLRRFGRRKTGSF